MEWISVKDRLPEKHKIVLCYSISDFIVVDSYEMDVNGEHWFYGDRESNRTDVTHWMPLPKPPSNE